MKIAVVVPSLAESGGLQTIVEMLVRLIERSEEHSYVLVSLATSASDECSTQLRRPSTWFHPIRSIQTEWKGRPSYHVGCSFSEFEFMRYRNRRQLNELLRNCDVVQIVSGFPAWGQSVLNCGRPVSIWAASRCLWERRLSLKNQKGLATYWRKLMTLITDRLDRKVSKSNVCMMVMNPIMGEYVDSLRGAPGSSVYAHPGVDIEWFSPLSSREEALRDDPYLLSVGRFADPRKNPGLLIEALGILKSQGSSVMPRLVLAGSTPPPESFWQRAAELGIRNLVSFVEKPDAVLLRDLYQNSMAYCLSSDEEGFGMVIVEAMACGIPAIATLCGGPDSIIEDAEDGFLVGIGDAQMFAERILTLASNRELNRSMGEKARQNVERKFSDTAAGKVFFETWNALNAQNS